MHSLIDAQRNFGLGARLRRCRYERRNCGQRQLDRELGHRRRLGRKQHGAVSCTHDTTRRDSKNQLAPLQTPTFPSHSPPTRRVVERDLQHVTRLAERQQRLNRTPVTVATHHQSASSLSLLLLLLSLCLQPQAQLQPSQQCSLTLISLTQKINCAPAGSPHVVAACCSTYSLNSPLSTAVSVCSCAFPSVPVEK